ncbi:MAG: carboxymuconolactone decarboxylase family protein [bacterium]
MNPSSNTDCYDKPIWTLGELLGELPDLPAHLARVAGTAANHPISGALRERIMLAVTAENRCFYCAVAHTTFGRAEGLTEDEIAALLAGDDRGVAPGEALALVYVRDLARRGFKSRDRALYEQLLEHFTEEQRTAIDSAARVINLANRFGNTFDAARARLTGCEKTGASGLDLAVVSTLFAAGAAVVSPLVGVMMLTQKFRGR